MWRSEQLDKAEGYLPDDKLVQAMNVALLLGQPLLLTGAPGAGKTQFAYYVSWMLRLHPPLIFETKSTSTARELFYTYDALARFRDVQAGVGGADLRDQLEYLTWGALGEAVLRAAGPKVSTLFQPAPYHSHELKSVVLIDEVDKAPRDFPNDLLNEVESLYFRIPEVRDPRTRAALTLEAEPDLRPIIILTSNSEKNLPDAFLRRCIYYNIPPPGKTELLDIVNSRVGRELKGAEGWLREALDLFLLLRAPDNGIQRKPATAELLGWLRALRRQLGSEGNGTQHLRRQLGALIPTLNVLLKSGSDLERGKEIVEKWSGR